MWQVVLAGCGTSELNQSSSSSSSSSKNNKNNNNNNNQQKKNQKSGGISSSFFVDVKNYAKNVVVNPDYQLANIL
jgi:hypothetical protein